MTAHRGAQLRIPRAYRFIIKYVAPLYLGAVFIGFCRQDLPGYVRALSARPVASATLVLVALVFLLLVLLARRAEQRWEPSQAAARPDAPMPDNDS